MLIVSFLYVYIWIYLRALIDICVFLENVRERITKHFRYVLYRLKTRFETVLTGDMIRSEDIQRSLRNNIKG